MKHLLLLVFTICCLSVNSQNQVSLLADWGLKRNELSPYKQSSISVLYRYKQNTFGLKYDIIDIKFRNFTVKQLYYVISGTASYYRHFNSNKLSGFYGGASVSYAQFSISEGEKRRYNDPAIPSRWGGNFGPVCEKFTLKQLSIIPTIGYECYPIKRLSLFAEIGYGLLLSNRICTDCAYGYEAEAPTKLNFAIGNLNFKLGIKTVIWRKTKIQE
jgi:hypothetical protein